MGKNIVDITSKTSFQRNRNPLILAIVAIIVGGGVFGAFLSLYLMNAGDWTWVIGIFAGLFALIPGIILVIQILRIALMSKKVKVRVETSFKEDEMVLLIFRDGEKVTESNIRYDRVLQFRPTKDYVFCYLSRNETWPLTRSDELIDFLTKKGIKKR